MRLTMRSGAARGAYTAGTMVNETSTTGSSSINSSAPVDRLPLGRLLARITLYGVVCFVPVPLASAATAAEDKIQVARELFFNCQKANIEKIVEGQTDAKLAALNLTNSCRDEYRALNKAIAQNRFDTSNEQRMFRIDQNAEMLKIEASLAIVNLHRQGKPLSGTAVSRPRTTNAR